MPNYVLQIRRVAKPGSAQKVLDSVVAQIVKANGQRNVSISLNTETGSGHLIIAARVLDSIDEIESRTDSAMSSMGNFDSIDSDCAEVRAEILKVLAPAENGPTEPKYMARNIFQARPGKAMELAEAILEIRELYGSAMKPLVTVPYMGNQDVVRATAIYDGLASFEKHADTVQDDKFKSAVQKVRDLRVSYVRNTARIVFMQSN